MSLRLGGGGGDRAREQRDRSAEERERAQQEREARRAAREGRAPRALPPLPAERPLPPEPEPVALAPAPADRSSADESPPLGASSAFDQPQPIAPPAAPEPAPIVPSPAPEPEPIAPPPAPAPADRSSADEAPPLGAWSAFDQSQPIAPPPAPESEFAPAPEPAPEPEFAPAEPASAREEPSPLEHSWAFDEPQALEEPARVVVQGRPDEPAGVKRVAASAMASAAGASGPPRFGAPPRGVPKRRRGARRVIPLLILAAVAAVAFFLFRLYEPGADGGEGRVAVTVPPGSGAEQIGELLAEQDIIDSRFFFSLRARMSGDNLRSGKVVLRRGMSYEAALAELTKAPPAAPVVTKITLPEGPGRKELAARVEQAGLTGSYVKASRSSTALDPVDFGAPQSASLEGFLFPATYELKPGSSAKALVTEQVAAFEREFAEVDMAEATRAKLSRYDVLIIASMIEREALVPKDRRLIAGVIYNRLKEGMPLGIDATTRFELENFTEPLKQSELERITPYNTRRRAGLPVGPIGNPGLASLKAAANPASNDFTYYVVKPCANGAHVFSSTDEAFKADVRAYNAKRDELGGKDPSQC